MRKIDKRCVALAGVLLFTAGAFVAAAEPIGPKLTPKLRNLLRQEMASVLVACQDILGALAMGDHATVAEAGAADPRQLHPATVADRAGSAGSDGRRPAGVRRARSFLPRDLGRARRGRRAEDVGQELSAFARMTEACVACHGRFAADRFPSLAQE